MIKYGETLEVISDGNAGKEKEGLRRRREAVMGHELQRLAAAVRRGRQLRKIHRPAFPNHPLAWAVVPSRGIALEKSIRFNKGLLGTTHKLCLGIGLRSRHSLDVRRVGRPQSPDVEPKTIVRLREIAKATATAIKIHLAGV